MKRIDINVRLYIYIITRTLPQLEKHMDDREKQIEIAKTENRDVMLQYGMDGIRKRVTRELENMYALYEKIHIHINRDGNLQITILDNQTEETNRYDFIINENYPFIQPTVLFQEQPYYKFLKPPFELPEPNENATKYNCACCQSILCELDWSPCTTFLDIIQEIQFYKSTKRNVI